jgi:MFS family permease
VVGILIFTISSLGCGLSQNIQTLLVLRAVQALGGGCLTPAATGIVADEFGRDRDRAIGFFSSIFPIGGMTGPILGGLFVTYWSWRGIFLINVPIGLALCVVAMVMIPSRSVRRPARFDVVGGVGLLGGGLLGCMATISYLGTGTARVTDAWFTGSAAAGVLLLCGFLRHSARAPAPFVSITLLAGPGWGVVNFINFFYGAAALGFGPLIPVYAEQRYLLEPLGAGSLLSARSIGMVVVAGVATMALRRTGTRKPIVVGYLIGAIGMALVAIRPLGMSPYVWLSVGAAVAGIGMGVSTPASNNAGMQLAPGAAASAAGLRGMFRQAGSITGVSVIAAIVARNDHPAQTEAAGFLAFALVLVLLLPLVRLVPDHRGRW